MNLSFCSGYRKVNLLITRCLEPDSIALIIPAADDVGFVNFVIFALSLRCYKREDKIGDFIIIIAISIIIIVSHFQRSVSIIVFEICKFKPFVLNIENSHYIADRLFFSSFGIFQNFRSATICLYCFFYNAYFLHIFAMIVHGMVLTTRIRIRNSKLIEFSR